MNVEKEQLVKALNDYEIYLASLNTAVKTDATAHTPIAEGKWSIAEIVMHLAEWDRFIREQRLPQMQQGMQVEKLPDVESFNQKAVAPVGKMSFHEVRVHAQRQRALLVGAIEEMSEARWHATFKIGNRETNAASYFEGILEHDAHHRKQIEDFLA